MRIKTTPEDFRVEELTDFPLVDVPGGFRVFRLTKRRRNTLDAVREAADAQNVPLSEVRVCGRKDRQGITIQYVTVPGTRDLAYEAEGLRVEHVGWSDVAAAPARIRGNMFDVVLRDMPEEEADRVSRGLERIGGCGFPNYFDEQRFGEIADGGPFLAELLVKRRFDLALRRYVTTIHPDAPPHLQRRKLEIREKWGDFDAVLALCPEAEPAALVRTARDRGYIAALREIPRESMGMLFSSYQSFLWNLTLAALVGDAGIPWAGPAGQDLRVWSPDAWQDGSARIWSLDIPTAARELPEMPPEVRRALDGVLYARKVRRSQFHIPEITQAYFASSPRAALVVPDELSYERLPDERYQGKWKVRARFSLPRGSFATLAVRIAERAA